MAQKIVIASGKGGVGKSSLTVGIGKALAKRGMKVLLVDCDCLKSLDLLTGVTQFVLYNWGDVLNKNCTLEQALYSDGEVDLLTCPDSYDEFSEYDFKMMIKYHEDKYDYILFDSPAGIEKGFSLACSFVNRGLVISTPDLVCVRSALAASRKMESMGIDNIRLIINRIKKRDISSGRLLNIDSVIDSTEIQLLGLVPEDNKIRLSSMGTGVYKRGQSSYRAFNNIASRILGETAKLSV